MTRTSFRPGQRGSHACGLRRRLGARPRQPARWSKSNVRQCRRWCRRWCRTGPVGSPAPAGRAPRSLDGSRAAVPRLEIDGADGASRLLDDELAPVAVDVHPLDDRSHRDADRVQAWQGDDPHEAQSPLTNRTSSVEPKPMTPPAIAPSRRPVDTSNSSVRAADGPSSRNVSSRRRCQRPARAQVGGPGRGLGNACEGWSCMSVVASDVQVHAADGVSPLISSGSIQRMAVPSGDQDMPPISVDGVALDRIVPSARWSTADPRLQEREVLAVRREAHTRLHTPWLLLGPHRDGHMQRLPGRRVPDPECVVLCGALRVARPDNRGQVRSRRGSRPCRRTRRLVDPSGLRARRADGERRSAARTGAAR